MIESTPNSQFDFKLLDSAVFFSEDVPESTKATVLIIDDSDQSKLGKFLSMNGYKVIGQVKTVEDAELLIRNLKENDTGASTIIDGSDVDIHVIVFDGDMSGKYTLAVQRPEIDDGIALARQVHEKAPNIVRIGYSSSNASWQNAVDEVVPKTDATEMPKVLDARFKK